MKRFVIFAALAGVPFIGSPAPSRPIIGECCPLTVSLLTNNVLPIGSAVPTFVSLHGSVPVAEGPDVTLAFDSSLGMPEFFDAGSAPPRPYQVTIGTDNDPAPPAPPNVRTSAVLFATESFTYSTLLEGHTTTGAHVAVELVWHPIGQDGEGHDIPPRIQYSVGGAYLMHVAPPAAQFGTRRSSGARRQPRIGFER